MRKIVMFKVLLIAILVIGLPAGPVAAQPIPQDVITVGSGSGAPGTVVDIPVYIRDTSGTPLGIDQPPGSRIQSYSIKVNYSNAAAVQSVTFTRAGITQSLTPTFESSPSGPGTITLLDTFAENTNLIPFVSNAPLPGNQVAHLVFTLSPAATPGTTITLTLDPTLTQLTDQGGSPATRETTTAGNLLLVNGAINVVLAQGPTLSTWALILLVASLAFLAVRTRL
jgi:hypothetical protein